MQSFLKHHAAEVKGTLSRLDRVRFRGTLRQIANVRGLFSDRSVASVLLKDFKVWAKGEISSGAVEGLNNKVKVVGTGTK